MSYPSQCATLQLTLKPPLRRVVEKPRILALIGLGVSSMTIRACQASDHEDICCENTNVAIYPLGFHLACRTRCDELLIVSASSFFHMGRVLICIRVWAMTKTYRPFASSGFEVWTRSRSEHGSPDTHWAQIPQGVHRNDPMGGSISPMT